ncbi:complement factor H-related protein 1-like [Anoplopoma fimbria]|uniref:complement factor H-related protein 1-like n=1 Tax=Anoplopoma fimbria TaxID=229290 RepID=UPI0023EC459C|nr:complement factor H-related protein 1-like [Anoplopoma fimbria]
MCGRRYLGFVLLVWLQGVLHVQTSDQPCSAPKLNNGYLDPEELTYNHDSKLTYSCDKGRKPAVEGWWATSTCHNGTWSPEPQCIDEKDCLAPNIPNAKYAENQSGWYEDGHTIRIRCNEGYVPKGWRVTTKCINGNWSSVLICEKCIHACSEPPQVPHTVIIFQGFQDFFAPDTELQYECEDGYTIEGADNKKTIYCLSGNWIQGPVCSGGTDRGHGGSGGHATSAGSGTQPEWGVEVCGKPPVVPNGDVVGYGQRYLRYECSSFYKLVGPEKVVCYSDGTWSNVPYCRVNFCSVDTDGHPLLKPAGVHYMKYGEEVRLPCVRDPSWWTDHYSLVKCINGRTFVYDCCTRFARKSDRC